MSKEKKAPKPPYAPPKKLKSWERNNGRDVVGSTVIDHNLRLRLLLTPTEYIFLDFIRTWQIENPTERITYQDLWLNTGIKREMVPRLWHRCQIKDMVVKLPSGIVVTSEKWNEAHADMLEKTTTYTIDKDKNKTVELDFEMEPGYKEMIIEFVEYRRMIKKPIKTKRAVKSRYDNLLFHSRGDLELAKKIFKQTLDKEWQDFYKLIDPETTPFLPGVGKMIR